MTAEEAEPVDKEDTGNKAHEEVAGGVEGSEPTADDEDEFEWYDVEGYVAN